MNTWTPQTGVKYSGLSTSPKKKKKKKKKKKNGNGWEGEVRPGREKSGGSGLQEEKKKKSEPK